VYCFPEWNGTAMDLMVLVGILKGKGLIHSAHIVYMNYLYLGYNTKLEIIPGTGLQLSQVDPSGEWHVDQNQAIANEITAVISNLHHANISFYKYDEEKEWWIRNNLRAQKHNDMPLNHPLRMTPNKPQGDNHE
tara:strand:- start:2 stop:403 length:402 start_codon:yes stop_codon:yes gene_type:complete